MKTVKILLIAPILLILIQYGCTSNNEEDLYPTPAACDTVNVTYSGTIAPIMAQHCNVCHDPVVASGGVVTNNYTDLRSIALNGSLSGAVNWSQGYPQMPQGGSKLSECNLKQIDVWIRAGAPNN
jgi:hypothetical protein